MINHCVFFKLKYPKGSSEERIFLNAASKLSTISFVKNFQVLNETSSKNEFDYGLKLEFDDYESYMAYNEHPHHAIFLKMYWDDYVDKYMEIDYELIENQYEQKRWG
ncbi:Dabb family protein [Algoriphagus sp.]|uniref:Dabb family protein n=1 Tax=Algoriphagus sp. TaxID=1872435 RepID=UPI0025F34664|nr:Dabb family protein [Algoriphagus sp.]